MARKKDKKAKDADGGRKIVARNRRARHDYHIELTVEAGLVLRGTEVKSLREGRASIERAFARIQGGELWLLEANIPEYGSGSWTNHQPQARRKLLLHRREIRKLENELRGSGKTLVPLQIHFTDRGIAKIVIALGTGKRRHDKRETTAKKEAEREMERARRRSY